MPNLDTSELNIVISILGAFIMLYGIISCKIKNVWYLGEALPAVMIGIALGPIASRLIDSTRWGSATPDQQSLITLGMCRVVIGVQLVIAGFQLPAKYQLMRWKEMLICLLPIMTIMWLCTTACVLATIPKLTLVNLGPLPNRTFLPFQTLLTYFLFFKLAALVIGSCVTCTDPILSQAIAKGPFADKYVARNLREIISSEAGANDGFGFPFLMLATYLIRHADIPGTGSHGAEESGSHGVGRLGGGVGKALEQWVVETWLYIVLMSAVYGVLVGYGSCKALKFALKKRWIDNESYLLFPAAIGLFTIGTCGALGTDDLLACFFAGNALNWDGQYLEETEARHDEVNSSIDVLLNFGGFMYIGAVLPWSEFNQPDVTGITYGRLFGLGFLVMVFRRIPAVLIAYKFMPNVCKNIKEALFMGYFGPIGIGAVFYLEHTRHLFPELGEGDAEETNLVRALGPTVYWLVLFSIVFHGLSIPALDLLYKRMGVAPVIDAPVELRPLSVNAAKPKNSSYVPKRGSVVVYNRFSRGFAKPEDAPPAWSGRKEVEFDDGYPLADRTERVVIGKGGVQFDDGYPLTNRERVTAREMV